MQGAHFSDGMLAEGNVEAVPAGFGDAKQGLIYLTREVIGKGLWDSTYAH